MVIVTHKKNKSSNCELLQWTEQVKGEKGEKRRMHLLPIFLALLTVSNFLHLIDRCFPSDSHGENCHFSKPV